MSLQIHNSGQQHNSVDKKGLETYTLTTNGALKDLIGSFTLSQIQYPILCFRGPLSRVPRRTPMLWCSEAPLRCFRAPHIRFFEAPIIVALGHPVRTCIPLRYLYYDLWVLQGTHFELQVLRGTLFPFFFFFQVYYDTKYNMYNKSKCIA